MLLPSMSVDNFVPLQVYLRTNTRSLVNSYKNYSDSSMLYCEELTNKLTATIAITISQAFYNHLSGILDRLLITHAEL